MKIFEDQAIDSTTNATVYSSVWHPGDGGGRVGVQLKWTGTPTSVFTLQTSNDHEPDESSDDDWYEESIPFPDSPAGSAGDTFLHVANVNARHCRVKVATSGGTGTINGSNAN